MITLRAWIAGALTTKEQLSLVGETLRVRAEPRAWKRLEVRVIEADFDGDGVPHHLFDCTGAKGRALLLQNSSSPRSAPLAVVTSTNGWLTFFGAVDLEGNGHALVLFQAGGREQDPSGLLVAADRAGGFHYLYRWMHRADAPAVQ